VPQRSVLVVGAGIAGPALAFWLHRHGFAPTVVERAPGPRPGGHAVDLRGVAREVMARMGLLDAVRAASLRTVEFSTVDAAGTVLRTVRADEHGGDGPLAEIEVLRGDLAAVLHGATGDDVPYRFGERIVTITDGPDGVEVVFASGARERYDLVVGADRQHSQVRAVVLGDGPDPVHPMGLHSAWWRTDNYLGLRDRGLDYVEGDRVAGVRTVDGNRAAVVYLGFPSDGLPPGPFDAAQAVRIVREQTAGMGWEVPRLVAGVGDPAAELFVDGFCQVVLERWSRGRVGLVGDAACCSSPLSGQGTGLALVGAYVLAGELAADPDHTAALARCEAALRPWVARTQARARDGGDGEPISALANAFVLPDWVAR
jgi:2-polyprenyl-6-methoxyphenol hydroxylase-like FAD-dependent oxidoreductase